MSKVKKQEVQKEPNKVKVLKTKIRDYSKLLSKYKNRVEYSSNNSGGSWWVNDDGWKALEKAGWIVKWVATDKWKIEDHWRHNSKDKKAKLTNLRWLDALATEAFKPNCSSMREAVDEWEALTGCRALDAGCPCCGQPHHFTVYLNDKEIQSGPETSYEASW